MYRFHIKVKKCVDLFISTSFGELKLLYSGSSCSTAVILSRFYGIAKNYGVIQFICKVTYVLSRPLWELRWISRLTLSEQILFCKLKSFAPLTCYKV